VDPTPRSEPRAAPDAGRRRTVFLLTWLAYGAYYLSRKPFAVGKASLRSDFGLSLPQLAAIETGYLVAYAVGQFVSGALGDRLGSRKLVGGGMLLVAACTAAFGVSSGLVAFALAFGLCGLFQSTGWPGTVKAMTAMYGPDDRGTVMGLWGTCYQVGGLGATTLAAWLLGRFGWRTSWLLPALLTALVGLLVLAKLDAGHPVEPKAREESPSKRVYREPLVWVLGAAYFCLKLIRYSLLFWLPLFLHDRLGYSPERSGYLSISFEVGGVAGAILGGILSDRTLGRRGLVCVAMTAMLAASCWLYPLAARGGVVTTFLGMALIGFMLFGPDALVSSVAAQDVGGEAGASTAAGVINGLGSIGAIAQGALTSVVVARFGWDALFYAFIALALIASAVLVPYALRPVARR
jgi:sugar phosphate permease